MKNFKTLFTLGVLFSSMVAFAQRGCENNDQTLNAFIDSNGNEVYYCKKPTGKKYYLTFILNPESGGGTGTGSCGPQEMCEPTGKEDTSNNYTFGGCMSVPNPDRKTAKESPWAKMCWD